MADVTPELLPERYDGPAASRLIPLVQAEYVVRYGGPDRTPVDPEEFVPPRGLFLIARIDGQPRGCGGFRRLSGDVGELKRMYVTPESRGQGLARALLHALEDAARRAGCRYVQLETGNEQPEAIGLYTSSGYASIAPYGYYRDAPGSRCFGKAL